MEMVYCPNCDKVTGYKRTLRVGTFIAIVLTAGLWILAIPFYRKRCIRCGGLYKGIRISSIAESYGGEAHNTRIRGDLDHMTAVTFQKHLIKAHNGNLFMIINRGNLGGACTYISMNDGQTWNLSKQHNSRIDVLGSIVQDPINYDIYVAYTFAAGSTLTTDARNSGNANWNVYVDKLRWTGSTWGTWTSQFGGAVMSSGSSSTAYTFCDIAIDSNRVLWVDARYMADNTPTYYVRVAYYDLVTKDGKWTVLDQAFGTQDSGTQKYGLLIAYGLTTRKMGLIVQDLTDSAQQSGICDDTTNLSTYKFWSRNDSDPLVNGFSIYGTNGVFCNRAENHNNKGVSTHMDADVDSSGNIWFVHRNTSTASIGCMPYNDATSAWMDEQTVAKDSDYPGISHPAITVMKNDEVFVTLDGEYVANNTFYIFKKAGTSWNLLTQCSAGSYMRRQRPAKLNKLQLNNHLDLIWQTGSGKFCIYFGTFAQLATLSPEK